MNRLLGALFRRVVAYRVLVLIAFAAICVPAAILAARVRQDNSPDRLVIKGDPDQSALDAFDTVFGGGDYVLLLAEAPDPYAPSVLTRLDALERALEPIPHVSSSSALSTFRRARGGFVADAEQSAAFRAFATTTRLFRQQGIVGDHSLAIPLILDAHDPETLRATLAAIDAVYDQGRRQASAKDAPGAVTLRKVGETYVDAWLDHATRQGLWINFGLFGMFVIVITLVLFRSGRTLAAFLVVLAVNSTLTMGLIGATGGVLTIVSSLVPMSILIVTTSTLVYLQSRFVDRPRDRSIPEHLVESLLNKFLPCTASIFATAAGFAALAVSRIQPIRDLGLWVAMGLFLSWLALFTLFPALQSLFKTPTQIEQKVAGQWFLRLAAWLPGFSYRLRWIIVPAAALMCVLGGGALFGIPGHIAPMRLEADALEYINHRSALYKDTRRLEASGAGLALTEVWLASPVFGRVTDVESLRALDAFQGALESDPMLRTVTGPTTVLRLVQYAGGGRDQLPAEDDALERLAGMLEGLLPSEPMLRRFIDAELRQTHYSVTSATLDWAGHQKLEASLRRLYDEVKAKLPALGGFTLAVVGGARIQSKTTFELVPTLVESFALTVVIIFGTFLVLFRNGAARVMAMIPSLFAILVMFGVMRVAGMHLNIATILIASIVLGASENDQIHFFYHFLEKRKEGGTAEDGLRHALLVAGRAIFFATLISAGGFLAFAISKLPPLRQFGLLSALAFVLSMLADFLALPAALWIVLRAKPDLRPATPRVGAVELR